jgi:predicted dehydrogenase
MVIGQGVGSGVRSFRANPTQPSRAARIRLRTTWGNRLADIPDAEVVSCFARSAERRAEFARRHGCSPAGTLAEFLDQPLDGVIVATPHSTHVHLVGAITAAGHNSMVEKPIARSGLR